MSVPSGSAASRISVRRQLVRSATEQTPLVLTLGTFDGVHRGHQAIIQRALEHARRLGGTPAALTFHPHPLSVVMPANAPLLLGALRQRLELLTASGIEAIYLQRF